MDGLPILQISWDRDCSTCRQHFAIELCRSAGSTEKLVSLQRFMLMRKSWNDGWMSRTEPPPASGTIAIECNCSSVDQTVPSSRQSKASRLSGSSRSNSKTIAPSTMRSLVRWSSLTSGNAERRTVKYSSSRWRWGEVAVDVMYGVVNTIFSCFIGLLAFRSSMKLAAVAAKINSPFDFSTKLASASLDGQDLSLGDRRTRESLFSR